MVESIGETVDRSDLASLEEVLTEAIKVYEARLERLVTQRAKVRRALNKVDALHVGERRRSPQRSG